ncbi:hypothetical protein [Sphingobium yanoikuyae]|uniref:hypothetical protein n=1 Tax=Sphingobium yanoikuyae TaxID=13690 RepID=UPI0004982DF1|nr:hypothetical protein [Sphingobium yanoikuyae]
MKKFLILLVSYIVIGVIPALRFSDSSIMFSDALARGFGRTLAVGLLSCLGLLYKRNKTLGFGIAVAIFSVLGVIAEIKQGTL